MFELTPRPDATPKDLERVVEFSKEVSDLIDKAHPTVVAVDAPRIAIAMALFMQALEHRHAILALIHLGVRSSAAALIRPCFEAYYRGMWALKCASDDQLSHITKAENANVPPLSKIFIQLRKNPETRDLANFDSWDKTGGYVHSGPLQVGRWMSEVAIEPMHSTREAAEMLMLSDYCGLLACKQMVLVCKGETKELDAKTGELILRRITLQVVQAYFGDDWGK